MAHYVKIFDHIIHSTIWMESASTRVVWITMLAMADKNGEVMSSIPGLAKAAGVTVEECEAALAVFLSPDPHSRSKVEDGKRITVIEGGWELINYLHYRELKSKEQERELGAIRSRRFRERNATSRTVTEKTDRHESSRQEEEEEYKENLNQGEELLQGTTIPLETPGGAMDDLCDLGDLAPSLEKAVPEPEPPQEPAPAPVADLPEPTPFQAGPRASQDEVRAVIDLCNLHKIPLESVWAYAVHKGFAKTSPDGSRNWTTLSADGAGKFLLLLNDQKRAGLVAYLEHHFAPEML